MERIPLNSTDREVFRAYLLSDGTVATGKTIAITISKNGGAFANPNAGATNATEISDGFYYWTRGTTDTNTSGPFAWKGTNADIRPVGEVQRVVNANNAGFAGIPDAAAGAAGGLWILGANAVAATSLTGSSGNPGLLLTGGSNSHGLSGVGTGAGSGIRGIGGATAHGIFGVGGATFGHGFFGSGTGVGHGIAGTANGTGSGVFGSAQSNGSGASFQSIGGGSGITAVGASGQAAMILSSTNASGLLIVASNGDAITLVGSGAGNYDLRADTLGIRLTTGLLDDVLTDVDTILTRIGVPGVSIADDIAGLNDISEAQVKAQFEAAFETDATTEPTGVPSATAPHATKLGYLYKVLMRGMTTDADEKVFLDASGLAEWKKLTSDDGTTYTEGSALAP